MYCLQCGSHNPENAAFCGICGKRFERGASSPQFSMGGGQPSQGEYMLIMQDMPPESDSPQGQGNPLMQDIAPTGYGLPQHYNPPAFQPYPSPEQATPPPSPASSSYLSPGTATPFPPPYQEWGTNNPVSYPGQPPLPFTNEQAVQLPLMYRGSETYPGASPVPTTPSPVAPEPWYKKIAKPLPVWAFLGIIGAVVALLVVLQLTGSDWAVGAMHVAIAAGIIAAVVAVATVVRTLLGMGAKTHPRLVVRYISAGLSILLLLTLCLAGFTQQSTIHGLQAHNLEGQQQWQSAINEYQLAGEGAPTSENIARVYNEWGEQFTSQQHYQDAFAKFNTVLNNYSSASTGVARAQSGNIKAYLGWAQQASQHHDYATATSRYDALLQQSYCTASCQSQVRALDATAYYNLAESQLSAKNYVDAVSNFQTVVSRFANSPEAIKLHEDYAKALLGHGQQQLTSASCSSAIPTYQQLSSQFGDTPGGQQATSALKAPQPVKGRFVKAVPNNPSLTQEAALMQGLQQGLPSNQFFQMLSSSPTAIIQSDGSFSFKPMKQGSYDLAWGTNNNVTGSQSFVSYFNQNDGSPAYVANVGPLCAFDFGNISQDIPVAS